MLTLNCKITFKYIISVRSILTKGKTYEMLSLKNIRMLVYSYSYNAFGKMIDTDIFV